MKIQFFSLKRAYEIPCKLYSPEDRTVENIILGVHGFTGDKDSSMLEKLAEHACLKNTALLCFDFPAHGKSPVNEDMLTVENCKKDFCALAEYVRNNYSHAKKYVFATSFGGFITILCAEKLRDFKLVLRAPAVSMPKVLLDNVLKISAEEFREINSVSCGFDRPICLPYSFYEELIQEKDPYHITLSVPTLMIHGDQDDIVPLSHILTFAKTQENARLEILPNTDHRFKKPGQAETVIKLTANFFDL